MELGFYQKHPLSTLTRAERRAFEEKTIIQVFYFDTNGLPFLPRFLEKQILPLLVALHFEQLPSQDGYLAGSCIHTEDLQEKDQQTSLNKRKFRKKAQTPDF